MPARCPFCSYVWESKVASPKKCPRCQRRLDKPEIAKPAEPAAVARSRGFVELSDLELYEQMRADGELDEDDEETGFVPRTEEEEDGYEAAKREEYLARGIPRMSADRRREYDYWEGAHSLMPIRTLIGIRKMAVNEARIRDAHGGKE